MAAINPRSLFAKLNDTCRKGLEGAAGLCLSRTHFHVEIEHWLLKLLESPNCDLGPVLRQYDADINKVKRELDGALGKFKTGNGRAPDLSSELLDLIREAWVYGSLECGAARVRTGHLVAAALSDRMLSMRVKGSSNELAKIPEEKLAKELKDLLPRINSEENAQEQAAQVASGGQMAAPATNADGSPAAPSGSQTPNLDQFTMNLTAQAKSGKIDRILGRDAEIRQVIDILTRRRQNNPILTGSRVSARPRSSKGWPCASRKPTCPTC